MDFCLKKFQLYGEKKKGMEFYKFTNLIGLQISNGFAFIYWFSCSVWLTHLDYGFHFSHDSQTFNWFHTILLGFRFIMVILNN